MQATVPPLFRMYTIEQLSEITGYSETYLVELKREPSRVRPRFRRNMSHFLKRTEAELFGVNKEQSND